MLAKVLSSALILVVALWCLLFSERLQRRITMFHEDLKRSPHASRLFLQVSSLNFELFLRGLGMVLLVVFIALAGWLAFEIENYK
ncbi:MAG: hypothetical protein FJ387_02670 [Verrucomicrobia bacterium]|nr:hypothetical protein [Verrucomicrobiota bacterium]